MELFFLRHAVAVPRGSPGYPDDSLRPLTAEGTAKMRRIAKGMRRLNLEFDLIVSSPYRRAQQTARIAATELGARRKLKCSGHLTPDGSQRQLIAELNASGRRRILLVGHEPFMSDLLAVLLTGTSGLHLVLKKGGLCKITAPSLRLGQCAQLDWLLTPKQLILAGESLMAGPPRIAQVEALLTAFDWEIEHCRHVRDLAVALFDQLQPLHQLGPEERDILNAAALLHDIGWTVAGQKHHKHSYRLIRESEAQLIGFTPAQVELIAQVARYHRKSPPAPRHAAFAALTPADQTIVRRLSALLRLADGLDRPHLQQVKELSCEVVDRHVRIHLKVIADPVAHVTGGERKRDWFEAVFGLAAEFIPQPL